MLLRARINSPRAEHPVAPLGSMWVAAMCEESWESIGPWIKSSVFGFASKYASNADNDPGAKITWESRTRTYFPVALRNRTSRTAVDRTSVNGT